MKEKIRCPWSLKDDLYKKYHDEDWGVPVHDDIILFEMLNLEGAQAGLSWYTVLAKRENYRKAFDNWNVEKIAGYSDKKVELLVLNPAIIRNRLKIQATIKNAKAFLTVKEEFQSFDNYIWQFVNHTPLINHWKEMKQMPAETKESIEMSKNLLGRGFKFVGSTICYAYMQAVGMVDDHLVSCWKRTAKR
jgi:DNA-3-methyladenine glycosylase I